MVQVYIRNPYQIFMFVFAARCQLLMYCLGGEVGCNSLTKPQCCVVRSTNTSSFSFRTLSLNLTIRNVRARMHVCMFACQCASACGYLSLCMQCICCVDATVCIVCVLECVPLLHKCISMYCMIGASLSEPHTGR